MLRRWMSVPPDAQLGSYNRTVRFPSGPCNCPWPVDQGGQLGWPLAEVQVVFKQIPSTSCIGFSTILQKSSSVCLWILLLTPACTTWEMGQSRHYCRKPWCQSCGANHNFLTWFFPADVKGCWLWNISMLADEYLLSYYCYPSIYKVISRTKLCKRSSHSLLVDSLFASFEKSVAFWVRYLVLGSH